MFTTRPRSSLFHRIRPLLALAGALGVVGGACTASLDFIECREDADCDRFAGDGERLRCVNTVCEVASCSSHGDCAGDGDSFLCGVGGECVDALAGPGCEILGRPAGLPLDKLRLIGAIYNRTAASHALFEVAYTLALDDFNGGTTLATGEQVAIIGCDSGGTAAGARSAARHLVESIGVPAILGPNDDEEFISVAQEVTTQPGNLTFTMSPMANALPAFSDRAILWRTTPGVNFQGKALRDRVVHHGAASSIMLFPGNNYGIGVYQAITAEVNDGTGLRVIPGVTNQVNLSYSLDEGGVGQLAKLLEAIPEPDAIILIAGDEVEDMLRYLHEQGVSYKRVYVTHTGLRGVQKAIVELDDAGWLPQIEMIGPLVDHPENANKLYMRLDAEYPDLVLGREAPLAYDAAMTTLLAMRAITGAAAEESFDGQTIATRMTRLGVGTKVSFGDLENYAFVKAAANAFENGNTIDVIGMSGELNFIETQGQPCSPFIAWEFRSVESPVPHELERYEFNCPNLSGSW